ncbi:MAG: carbohydrate ABC transporter permease [Christensenellales bacterium]
MSLELRRKEAFPRAGGKMKNDKAMRPGQMAATILLLMGSLVVMLPLIWMLSTALKSDAEVMVNSSFIPRDWRFDNFAKAWQSAPFDTYLQNSVFITLTCLAGTLLSCSLVAYGFAKIRFRGKDLIFLAVLGTMMIPGMVTLIPTYVMFSRFGWVGTYLPLIIPAFGGSAYYVFLLRQYFLGIPMAYNEAAKLEGASELSILLRIILPMAKPALTTIAVFEFNAKWNDYFSPMLYLDNEKMYTLQLGLRTFRGTAGVEWQKFMAASLIVLLPTVIIYAIMQRYIIQGVAVGGIKG